MVRPRGDSLAWCLGLGAGGGCLWGCSLLVLAGALDLCVIVEIDCGREEEGPFRPSVPATW